LVWYQRGFKRNSRHDEIYVIEPAVVKINAIKAATEAATLIIRIDDLIAAGRKSGAGKESKKEGKKEEEEKKED